MKSEETTVRHMDNETYGVELVKNAIKVIYCQIAGKSEMPTWEECEQAYKENRFPEFNKEVDYILGE